MITGDDIVRFYDAEAEAGKRKYDELMRLPVGVRIRKRKAIDRLTLEEGWCERSPEKEYLFLLRVEKNLSDFKEGDYLLLHEEGSSEGLKCTLYAFTDDEDIIISVSSYSLSFFGVEQLYGKPLVLDTVSVDLRAHVNANFYAKFSEEAEWWRNLLINSRPAPRFLYPREGEREVRSFLDDYGISFTDKQYEAVVRAVTADDYFLIQGPPGTGKSFVLAVIILEELLYFHRKVAVVGPNHLAINNALKQVLRLSPDLQSQIIKVGPFVNARGLSVEVEGREVEMLRAPRVNSAVRNRDNEPVLYGFTSFALYTSRARDLEFDTLIIDEAGQMTVPNALMAMLPARKVILAGDHKQLPPIIASEKVPADLRVSVFERLLRPDNHTMLDLSFRMRGEICDFVSELFYGGGLRAKVRERSRRVECDDALLSFDVPVVLLDVEDRGLQCSEREADEIVELVAAYVGLGLPASEIAALSPFRAQAALVRRRLKRSERLSDKESAAVAADTVDKMQGQEREVIIVSLAAGDEEYMKEMGEFLYNPNKLNVAFSRAKSKLIVVGNIGALRRIDSSAFPHIAAMLRYPNLKIVKH